MISKPFSAGNGTMSIAYTVALCTHNHADRLARTLADLSGLRPPEAAWELLVVDNASRDATPQLLASYAWPKDWQVRIVREEILGVAYARNRAIKEGYGEYLIFLDDDETPDPEWLRTYEHLIRSKHPDAIGGRIEVSFETPRPAWLQDELLGFLGRLDHGATVHALTELATPCYTGNFGLRRAICDSVGYFDTTLGRRGTENEGGEDVDFYRRLINAGFQVWWTPEAVIYHRIQAAKLTRGYFLDLHYRQGRMESIRRRAGASRIPPKYFYGQLWRACQAVWRDYRAGGRDATLRRGMNVAYFLGQITGWAFGPQSDGN